MNYRRSEIALGLACFASATWAGLSWRPRFDSDLEARLPGETTARGFTTSDTCRSCHPDQYESWRASYHRTMTQPAVPEAVLGAFDVTLENRGYRWRLERRGGEFWVEMPDPVWFDNPSWFMRLLDATWPESPPRIEARVVMTTGSHHVQNYWIRRPEGEGTLLGPDDGSLVEMPWAWLVQEKRWVPNQDSFLAPPSDAPGASARWNANCSQCHSVGTEPRPSESFGSFDTRSAELGIACEACHGPAGRHVEHYRSPLRRYLSHLRRARGDDSPEPTIVNPVKLDAERTNEVCGQCHSFGEWVDQSAYMATGISFVPGVSLHESRRTFHYADDPTDPILSEILDADSLALEGRFWRDGTIRVAGREYNAFLGSTHDAEAGVTCLSCHSMHGYEVRDSQLDPRVSGNQTCAGCHQDLADGLEEHSRHAPGSPGSECMNCHMPHTTYGLFSAMRSHRIDSPSARTSLDSGRPNACNLCHLDRTLAWTSRYLNEWYGEPLVDLPADERSFAAAALWALRGDAAQRTIIAWHMGWGPARDASGESWVAPYLAQLMADPYAATREVAHRSVVTLPGFADFRYDFLAPPETLGAKADEAMTRWLRAGARPPGLAALLLDDVGGIDLSVWLRLLSERDDRPLTIRE